jgi:hypothetical protein
LREDLELGVVDVLEPAARADLVQERPSGQDLRLVDAGAERFPAGVEAEHAVHERPRAYQGGHGAVQTRVPLTRHAG